MMKKILVVIIVILVIIGFSTAYIKIINKIKLDEAVSRVENVDMSAVSKKLDDPMPNYIKFHNLEIIQVSDNLVAYIDSVPHSHISSYHDNGFAFLRINNRVFFRNEGFCSDHVGLRIKEKMDTKSFNFKDLYKTLKHYKFVERTDLKLKIIYPELTRKSKE